MRKLITLSISVILLFSSISDAMAHQPYFEEGDTTSTRTLSIADPRVSTAMYGTLDSPNDVDFYTFQGWTGAAILLGMSIPEIDGQEDFTPSITLIGPGLAQSTTPADLSVPAGSGTVTIDAAAGSAQIFFEPFSRTSYWRRQRQTITLPADGQYTVAVWSNAGQVGRYTLVVGDREVRGGDPAFSSKIRDFWTPVVYTPPTPLPVPTPVPTLPPPTATTVPTAIPPTATPLPTVTPLPTATAQPKVQPRSWCFVCP